MAIASIGGKPAAQIQALVDLRAKLDDLQRQLSTGKKASTYAGLGLYRGVAVGLRSQLSAITSFDATADNVQARINVAQTALSRMSDISNSVKTAMMQGSYGTGTIGANTAQTTAQFSLDEMLSLLNSRAGDHYLFSGRTTDQPAVESYDHILNGDGAKAGLKQIISERAQADLGASGLGRLTITSPTATSLSVAEDAATPFGFKLASVSSSLTNGAVSGPTGAPPAISVDLSGGVPAVGDTLTLRFDMPDGTTENLTLTATTTSPPGANQFLIGADEATTTANLSTALNTSIGKLAATALKAASAVKASSEFFSADASTPPPRVDGPPFDSATAMTTGSSADTVIWYTGETGTDSARSSATARIDPNLSVGYGVRGNEEGLRTIVQNLATLAAVTVSPTDPNGGELSAAMNQRLTSNLAGGAGIQSVADIRTDLASAQVSIKAAKDRHQQQTATLADYLQQIEGVSNEDVGTQILTLQTRLQASMQVTSMMYQTSLVNYM
ncbi:MAG: flagellar biosynthesis protein FlgL [Pseudolabrys sp.]|nr:flagellar biosynthesis protein FlgL [Pseudolabrys sp.]MDP2295159.1 flagellar biosynthesis protein FlgL [Pseudolabrys sp.]